MDEDLLGILHRVQAKYLERREAQPEFAVSVDESIASENVRSRDVRKAIFGLPEPAGTVFSMVPTEMTRLMPFFPISDQDKKTREYTEMAWENSWGRMTLKGLKLSVYDQDILLALIRLFQIQRTLTIETTRHEILRIIGRSRGSKTVTAIDSAIERLTGTLITLEVWDKGRKNPVYKMGNTLLSGYVITKVGKISLTLNPYFQKAYWESMVTSLDMTFRMSLRHDVSKSLHLFLTAQPVNYQIHIQKLAPTIHLNMDQHIRHVRQLLSTAGDELHSKGFLEFFGLKDDMMTTRKKK